MKRLQLFIALCILTFPIPLFATVNFLAVNDITNEIAEFESGGYGLPWFWKSIPSEPDEVWELWGNSDTHMYGYKKIDDPFPYLEFTLFILVVVGFIWGCVASIRFIIRKCIRVKATR